MVQTCKRNEDDLCGSANYSKEGGRGPCCMLTFNDINKQTVSSATKIGRSCSFEQEESVRTALCAKCVTDGQAVTAGCHGEVGWLVVAQPTVCNCEQRYI